MIDCDLQALYAFPLDVGNIKAITPPDTSVTLLKLLWCPLRTFAKIDAEGDKRHPLYRYLKENFPGVFGAETTKQNGNTFLVDRNGQIVKRYAPSSESEANAAETKKPHLKDTAC